MTTPQHSEALAKVAERIVRDAMPATDSGATCFVPRYQINQLKSAIADAFDGGTGMINVSADGVERIAPEEFRKPEAHSAEIHRKARELLAAEHDRDGLLRMAAEIRNGEELTAVGNRALRAIEAALSLTPPARYFAGGPSGSFFTDDLQLARDMLDAYDKDEDWTVTDLAAAPQPQADHFADVGKMMPQAEATRQPVTCKSDLQVQPEAKAAVTTDELIRQVEEAKRLQMERDIDPEKQPEAKAGADDDCAEDAAVWNLIGIAEKCGAKKDSDDNSTWWVLDVRAFYALEEVLRERVSEAMYRESEPKPAEGWAVLSMDQRGRRFERLSILDEAAAALEAEGYAHTTGAKVRRLRAWLEGLPEQVVADSEPAGSGEALGRDAEGVEALAEEGLQYFEKSGDAGDRKYVQAIRGAMARRLTASDARPVIDEAMVERALTEWFYDLSWADVQKEYEDGGDKLRNYMRAALTAALSPENKS